MFRADAILRRGRIVAALLAVAAASVACDDPSKPAIAIDGGGFIFNYRIAEAFYGVSIKPLRLLERGSVLQGEFENPDGGPPFVVREIVAGPQLSYALRTPPVNGVKAGRDYRVVVVLRSPAGAEVTRIEKTLRSDLDQDVLPSAPLVVGPLYTPNPGAQ